METETKRTDQKERQTLFRNLVWIALILGAIYGTVSYVGLENLERYVERAGIFGPLILILAKVATLVFAPLGGSPLYPIAGALFGPFYGFLYMFIGDAIGASLCFAISRYFGRAVALQFISRHGMVVVDQILGYLGTRRGMLEARLYFFAFPELISYAAGLTRISYGAFIGIHLLIYVVPIAVVTWLGDAIVGMTTTQVVLVIGAMSVLAGAGALIFYRRARNEALSSADAHHD